MPGLIHAVWARVSAAKLYRPADGKALMSFVVSGYFSRLPCYCSEVRVLGESKVPLFQSSGVEAKQVWHTGLGQTDSNWTHR